MKKRGASNGGGSELPESVIQIILSFMNAKDAAQTSVVSKSWHLAWSTIPDLDLDQRHYGRLYRSYCDVQRFLESARKRIQRYEDSNLTIKSFSLSMDRRQRSCCELADKLTLKALNLGATELSLSVCLYLANPISSVTINAVAFRNLNSLCLEWLDIAPLFSKRSSSDFPCLKVLTLSRCFSMGQPIIYISSTSIHQLNFDSNIIYCFELDVPSIRRFTFSGSTDILPTLDFKGASMDWDSDLFIVHAVIKLNMYASWFCMLEAFLKRLSMSKVSLSLEVAWTGTVIGFDYDPGDLNPAVVDNLKMDINLKYITGESNFFKCLLSSVEPMFITERWKDLQRRGYSCKVEDNYINLLCKALVLDVTEEDGCGFYRSRLSFLDHVVVECFEKALAKWQPLSLKTLLEGSAVALEDEQSIRFQLQWK